MSYFNGLILWTHFYDNCVNLDDVRYVVNHGVSKGTRENVSSQIIHTMI